MGIMTKAIEPSNACVILTLAVKPNSSRSEFPASIQNEYIEIKVHSPPDKGKANKEILKLLSKYFKSSCTGIEILSGHTSRIKRVLLRNAEEKRIHELLFKGFKG